MQTKIDLDLKSKVVSLNGQTLEISLDLNPFLLFNSFLATLTSISQAWYDLASKSNFFSLNGQTLEISTDLNPNS